MLRYIIWALILYSLFRLVFYFIIPVFKATRKMKQQVGEFQERMNGNGQFNSAAAQSHTSHQQAGPQKTNQPKKGDYIDFEEVK